MKKYNLVESNHEVSFDVWFEALNIAFIAAYGIGVEDLPDQPIRMYYDDNMTIEETIETIFEEAVNESGIIF